MFRLSHELSYLLARPAIPRGLATHDKVRSILEQRVNTPWTKKPGSYRNSEFVMVAAVLAYNDAATTGELHPLTRKALDRMHFPKRLSLAGSNAVSSRRRAALVGTDVGRFAGIAVAEVRDHLSSAHAGTAGRQLKMADS
jgi:hypothetical protein